MSFLLFHCLSFNASKFLFSFPFLYLCSNYVWITRKHRSLSDGQFFLSLLLLVLQIKYFSFSCFGFLILDVSSTSLQESIRHFSLSLLSSVPSINSFKYSSFRSLVSRFSWSSSFELRNQLSSVIILSASWNDSKFLFSTAIGIHILILFCQVLISSFPGLNSLLLDLSFIIFLVVDQIIFESQVSICEWLIPASIACFTDSRPNIKEKEIQAVLKGRWNAAVDRSLSFFCSCSFSFQILVLSIFKLSWSKMPGPSLISCLSLPTKNDSEIF